MTSMLNTSGILICGINIRSICQNTSPRPTSVTFSAIEIPQLTYGSRLCNFLTKKQMLFLLNQTWQTSGQFKKIPSSISLIALLLLELLSVIQDLFRRLFLHPFLQSKLLCSASWTRPQGFYPSLPSNSVAVPLLMNDSIIASLPSVLPFKTTLRGTQITFYFQKNLGKL